MRLLRHLPRFRAARAALAVMEERERWVRSDIEAFQLERLNQVWAHARSHIPYYRQLAQAHRLPDRFVSLAEYVHRMPMLDKHVVRAQPGALLSEEARPGTWHRTGGSTGVPMRVYWSYEAHRASLRVRYRTLDQWDLDTFDRTAFLWGHSGSIAPGWAGVKQRLRRPVEDWLRNRLRLSAYRLGPADLDEHLARLARFAPTSLYGYSSAVGLLATRAHERGIRLPSLRVALLTAEPADAATRTAVAEAFGCDAAVEYGSVECGNMAASDRTGALRVREDAVFLETHADADGHEEILVTVLTNPSFPLLRYRIGDVAEGPMARAEQGFAVLPGVRGRQNDILVSRSGRLVHPLAVKHALEHHPAVRRFRAHQDCDGALTVAVEMAPDEPLPEATVCATLTEMLGGYPVRIERTERLEGNRAGKHRWVISDLAATRERSAPTAS
ncbi:MAG: hypothetical protein AAFU38_11735 [Bacteroidota bacterium]